MKGEALSTEQIIAEIRDIEFYFEEGLKRVTKLRQRLEEESGVAAVLIDDTINRKLAEMLARRQKVYYKK